MKIVIVGTERSKCTDRELIKPGHYSIVLFRLRKPDRAGKKQDKRRRRDSEHYMI